MRCKALAQMRNSAPTPVRKIGFFLCQWHEYIKKFESERIRAFLPSYEKHHLDCRLLARP